MAEGEEKTEPPTEPAAAVPGSGGKPAPKGEEIPSVDLTEKPTAAEDLISKANAAAARQEEANKVHEALIAKQEAMLVEKTLGGKTEAGTGNKEETPEEYAKKVMAGETPEGK